MAELFNLEAEQSLLGSMLLEQGVINQSVKAKLVDDDFYSKSHQRIFRAIMRNYAEGIDVDIVTVMDALDETGELESAGGMVYLGELSRSMPTTTNAKHYLSIVKEHSGRRMIKRMAADADRLADNKDKTYEEIRQDVINLFEQTPSLSREGSTYTAAQLAQMAYQHIGDINKGAIEPLSTGLSDLDRVTGGLFPGELTILAARPGEGKSALAWKIAENVGKTKKVLFISREMGTFQLGARILSRGSGVSGQRMRRAKGLGEEEFSRMAKAMAGANRYQVHADINLSSPLEVRASMRGKGFDLLICDYLQIMRPDGRPNNREQEVSNISRGLKSLALEYNIPVLCLSQLSREVEKRTIERKGKEKKTSRPRLSDLRESGAIEQDADNVVFIHQPTKADVADDPEAEARMSMMRNDERYIELGIAKQRQGELGIIPIKFSPAQMEFTCFSDRSESNV